MVFCLFWFDPTFVLYDKPFETHGSEKHGVKENFKHFATKNSITSPKSQVKNIQSSCTQTLLWYYFMYYILLLIKWL